MQQLCHTSRAGAIDLPEYTFEKGGACSLFLTSGSCHEDADIHTSQMVEEFTNAMSSVSLETVGNMDHESGRRDVSVGRIRVY
jgi:hypothetical protein